MKALFVTNADFNDETYGGAKGSIRNYILIAEYANTDIYKIQKNNNWSSLCSIMNGFFPPTSRKDLKKIRQLCIQNKYDIVFVDNSYNGKVVKYLNKIGMLTIVFYHNCESDYNDVRFGSKKSIKKQVYKYLVDKNEKMSTEYSSYRITFSKRDAQRIKELYGAIVHKQIPLSIVDKYEQKKVITSKKCCLLFGPIGTANIEAFQWFVNNVSPKLKCKTVVAGKGFEVYKEKWENEKVEVIGFVEDLAQLYSESLCVAIPLFSGGGMKVKTVEAMMFGKYIFGTDEAFSGYDIDTKQIGGLCNNAKEFTEQINKFLDEENDKYNKYSRRMYEKEYSVKASKRIFRDVMNELGFEKCCNDEKTDS